MSETLSYIDNYFNGSLSAAEKSSFENRCASDPEFAKEVAFYIAARDELKAEMADQKKQEFDKLYRNLSASGEAPAGSNVRRMMPWIVSAAACLLLFLGYQVFFTGQSPQQMAGRYIDENLATLGVTMGGGDSLQTGIAAYNNKEYAQAEAIFKSLAQNNSAQHEAIRCLGIVYLVTNRYDEAIQQFDLLAADDRLYANPALFYKAVTLLKRSGEGDRDRAKTLLEEVVSKNLSGSKEAAQWLKKL